MPRLSCSLIALVFCSLLAGSPSGHACQGVDQEYTLFFNANAPALFVESLGQNPSAGEGLVNLPSDVDLVAEAILTGANSAQDGMPTAAKIVRVIKTSDARVSPGEEIPIRFDITSCGPNHRSGSKGTIAAQIETDIDDLPVLCPYSRRFGDGSINSPSVNECFPSITSMAKRTKLAAENGEATAQISLGLMYEKGRYARQNNEKALKWLHLAAESGEAEARYQLGAKYQRDRNDKEAVKWFKLAAAQGHAKAMSAMGRDKQGDSEVAKRPAHTAKQGGNDTKRELDMEALKLAAETGEAEAQYELGKMYHTIAYHDGKNADEAVKWFKLAAAQRHVQAMNELGQSYEVGKGVMKDGEEAAKWYRLGAELGDAEAQFHLGHLYRHGMHNKVKALEWYKRAAEQGHATAQYLLGRMFKEGDGVEHNDAEAAKWYRLAAEQGERFATRHLTDMYLQGRVVADNDEDAVKWYRLAAENGDTRAQDVLEALPQRNIP